MVIKLIISKSAFTEDFILRLWEAGSDSPEAHVYETTLVEKDGSGVPTPGAGHQVDEAVIANGLDKVVHIARLYGATSNNIYFGPENIESTTDIIKIFTPIQFKIGDGGTNTPAADQPNATTPELAGLTTGDFTIFRNNYGFLFPDLHFSFNTSDGSWQLLGGDVFSGTPGEEFTIQIKPQVLSSVVNDSVVGKWFGGFVDVSSNTVYDATHLRKLIRFAGTCDYAFNVNPPIGYGFVFQHFGALGTGTVKFNNAPLKWGATTKAEIDIPDYCEACFVFDGTNWNVVYITQSTFVNSSSPTPGVIIGIGTTYLGNTPVGDFIHTISHNLNIAGDYLVFFSSKSTIAAAGHDDDTQIAWYHSTLDKPNEFVVMIGQPSGSIGHDLTLCWMIIKV